MLPYLVVVVVSDKEYYEGEKKLNKYLENDNYLIAETIVAQSSVHYVLQLTKKGEEEQ